MPDKIKEFLHKTQKHQKTVKSSLWLISESLVRLVLSYITISQLSRYLSPDGLGQYNHSVAIIAILGAVATLGIDNLIIREFVKNPEKKYRILGTSFALRLVMAIISFILALIYVIVTKEHQLVAIVAIMGVSYIFKSFDVIDLWFQSQLSSNKRAGFRSFTLIVTSALILTGIYFKMPITYFALCYLTEFIINSIVYLKLYLESKESMLNWSIDLKLVTSFLKGGIYLFLSAVSIIIYMRIDQLMIANMLNNSELGIYSSAVKIVELWNFIPLTIMTTLLPSIVLLHKKDIYNNRMQLVYDLMLWIPILLSTMIFIFARFIILFIYNEEFLPAVDVVQIYVWSLIPVFIGNVSSRQLIAEGLEKVSFYRTFIGALSNIGLNIMLIPTIGVKGAAIATVVSYTLSAILSNLLFKQTRKIFWMNLKSLNIFAVFIRVKNYFNSVIKTSLIK